MMIHHNMWSYPMGSLAKKKTEVSSLEHYLTQWASLLSLRSYSYIMFSIDMVYDMKNGFIACKLMIYRGP